MISKLKHFGLYHLIFSAQDHTVCVRMLLTLFVIDSINDNVYSWYCYYLALSVVQCNIELFFSFVLSSLLGVVFINLQFI